MAGNLLQIPVMLLDKATISRAHTPSSISSFLHFSRARLSPLFFRTMNCRMCTTCVTEIRAQLIDCAHPQSGTVILRLRPMVIISYLILAEMVMPADIVNMERCTDGTRSRASQDGKRLSYFRCGAHHFEDDSCNDEGRKEQRDDQWRCLQDVVAVVRSHPGRA